MAYLLPKSNLNLFCFFFDGGHVMQSIKKGTSEWKATKPLPLMGSASVTNSPKYRKEIPWGTMTCKSGNRNEVCAAVLSFFFLFFF